MLRYLWLADTSLASVQFSKSLTKREVKRFKTEGRNSEDINLNVLMKTGQQYLQKGLRIEMYFDNEEREDQH
eukprot:snap_masked-scaffold_4-processed-gene-17.22-mRNA-1 protein AED:1.00 eAED:1.00 QI:0/0/0/0/1/1/2/0/71